MNIPNHGKLFFCFTFTAFLTFSLTTLPARADYVVSGGDCGCNRVVKVKRVHRVHRPCHRGYRARGYVPCAVNPCNSWPSQYQMAEYRWLEISY